MAHSYRELIAWQKAVQLVTEIYSASRVFPKEEMYGLTSHLRRAAVSIPSNIAEGQGRLSKKDFAHFLGLARGSLLELETQLTIAQNLSYLREPETTRLLALSGEVHKIINGLMASLNQSETELNVKIDRANRP